MSVAQQLFSHSRLVQVGCVPCNPQVLPPLRRLHSPATRMTTVSSVPAKFQEKSINRLSVALIPSPSRNPGTHPIWAHPLGTVR